MNAVSDHFNVLKIKAKEQVYTLLSGQNLSKLHGEGYDLSEIREYQVGDDIRKINWTITAKLGKPYIKELHADRELSVVVAAMLSGSLYFGEGNAKQQILAETAALLGYAAQHEGDLFTGVVCQEEKTRYLPPTKEIYMVENYARILYEATLMENKLIYDEALQGLFDYLLKPSLLFVIGDFLQPVDLSLFAQKHEVVVLIIRDRGEEHPKTLGDVRLVDPQSRNEKQTYFAKRSIAAYLAHLKENDHKLSEHFARYNIRWVKIYTDELPITKLLKLFQS